MEVWKDIPGYEGLYQVSNLGNVKSLPKQWVFGYGAIKSHNGIILKKVLDTYGYYVVSLRKNKILKTCKIHQLVAMAFLGHIPCGHKLVIDHINNDKLDNRVENLQIVTNRFNTHKNNKIYSSQYKGVHWNKARKKWISQIVINGKQMNLGYFDCELKASLAYQNKLKEII